MLYEICGAASALSLRGVPVLEVEKTFSLRMRFEGYLMRTLERKKKNKRKIDR